MAGVGSVDLLLVARQAPIAAGVRIEAATALRYSDLRSGPVVAVVG